MRLRYRDGSEADDELFDRPIEEQRQYVARCIQLGSNWVGDPVWGRLIDTLLSVRHNDGKESFYREIGHMVSVDGFR